MHYRNALPIFALAVAALLPHAASAASLSLEPATTTYGPGDTFIETVRVDNGQDCINAVNVEISYPTDTLRAVDFSRGDSIFSLWAVEPKIDTDRGTITFAGGIPGGYCGRISGDASPSDVLGKIVFTVASAKAPVAQIRFADGSKAYLNDGQGTPASLATKGATVTLSPVALQTENPWLSEVGKDTTPPQPFDVQVESTLGVFGGKYYIVFSTSDKESGLDHFEIAELGGWKRITSPYLLANQSFLGVGDVQVRAVDKAGNMRLGFYSASSTPQRQFSPIDFTPVLIFMIVILLLGLKFHFDQKKNPSPPSA